jgi:hypothetical protein
VFGCCRNRVQSVGWNEVPVDFDLLLYRDGLDGRFRGPRFLGARAAARVDLAAGGRSCLYGRSRFLSGQTHPIFPLRLAPIRGRRHRVSLLCSSVVCELKNREWTRTDAN